MRSRPGPGSRPSRGGNGAAGQRVGGAPSERLELAGEARARRRPGLGVRWAPSQREGEKGSDSLPGPAPSFPLHQRPLPSPALGECGRRLERSKRKNQHPWIIWSPGSGVYMVRDSGNPELFVGLFRKLGESPSSTFQRSPVAQSG
jgi:hypothetical protein